jgi:SAM-dependent methyltransferase
MRCFPQISDIIKSFPCFICGEELRRVVALKARDGKALTTVICTGCGMVHSLPVPGKEELEVFYRNQYRHSYKGVHKPRMKHVLRYAPDAMRRVRLLGRYVPQGAKILDIGSGSGEFLYFAGLDGFDATGVEPHTGYAEYSAGTLGLTVINRDYESAGLQLESWDAVSLNHVLEHLPDPLSVLSFINGILKRDAVLSIEVPDIGRFRHAPANMFHFAHIYNFNGKTLSALLEKSGFAILADNGGTTSIVARKVRSPEASRLFPMPGNYQTLWRGLSARSYWHFMKITPYERLLSKMIRYPRETILSRKYTCPRALLNESYRKLSAVSGY